ncbi:MmcQ/YjbR family DNA-binding protein [Kribbella rubisoli]|uniref:MmcQ/YjbR family DNA-binding protein n=1 Tax=Kribbella rubisoli TaxID=3075929 RepID=UPI001F5407F2|nr:MmcQ/YjbR family DNA-binding protein [Kribbella rubisoli]
MADVHEVASGMPHVTKWERDDGTDRPVYQVGGKSFVFFRTPRPDAVDPVTGEKYDDVIMIWVESEDEKLALVSDESTPFFTTPHFDGHPSVLIRGSELGEISKQELTEIIQDAWLSRASNRRATTWLKEHRLS